MRKSIFFALFILAVPAFISCRKTVEIEKEVIKVTKVSFDKTEMTLSFGSTARIALKIEPENATDKEIVWSSSNDKIVKVDETGTLTPVSKGTAVIKALFKDGGKKAECTVTVIVPLENLVLEDFSESPVPVLSGSTYALKVKLVPEGTSDMDLLWSCEPADFASVHEGKVTFAEKSGKVTVICTSAQNNAISVRQDFHITVQARSIQITTPEGVLHEGQTRRLEVRILPEETTEKGVTWTSDNPHVATVDGDGMLLAKGKGNARIQAVSKSNPKLSAVYDLTVQAVAGTKNRIRINGEEAIEYEKGKLKELLSKHSSIKKLEWEEGVMDGSDAGAMENIIMRLEYLDMKNVRIVAGGGTYRLSYNDLTTADNEFPSHLCDKGYRLTTVILPASITKIGERAFGNTSALQSITLPEGLETIERHAFVGSGLTSITFPSSVKILKDYAFSGAKLSGKLVLNDIEELDGQPFWGNENLTEVELGAKLKTSANGGVFAGCTSLTSITVKEDNPYFKSVDGVVYSKNGETLYFYPYAKVQETLHIPAGVKTIQGWAFQSCETFKYLVLNEGLENIYDSAFGSSKIESLVIPESVKVLNYNAFRFNKALKKVTLKGSTPPVSISKSNQFPDCPLLHDIYVPADAVEKYKKAESWEALADKIR